MHVDDEPSDFSTMMTAFLRGKTTTSKEALDAIKDQMINLAIEAGMAMTAEDIRRFGVPFDKYPRAVEARNLAAARGFEEGASFNPFMFFGGRLYKGAECYFEGRRAQVTGFEIEPENQDRAVIRLKISEPDEYRFVTLDHTQLAAYQKDRKRQLAKDVDAALGRLKTLREACEGEIASIGYAPIRERLHAAATALFDEAEQWTSKITFARDGAFVCHARSMVMPEFESLRACLARAAVDFASSLKSNTCDLVVEEFADRARTHEPEAIRQLIDAGFDINLCSAKGYDALERCVTHDLSLLSPVESRRQSVQILLDAGARITERTLAADCAPALRTQIMAAYLREATGEEAHTQTSQAAPDRASMTP